MSFVSEQRVTEQQAAAKWSQVAPQIDRLQARTDDEDDFQILPGSSLAGDDKRSDPYRVSHAVKHCLVAGIDHLHALKVLVVEAQKLHAAAPASLARGCLENMATAYWIPHPTSRVERVTRCLRWYWKNATDQHLAIAPLNFEDYTPQDVRLAKIIAVAERDQRVDVREVRRGYSSTAAVKYADMYAGTGLRVLLPWQICSGFAHGRPWASLSFSERETHPTADPEVMTMRFTTDLARASYLALAGMHLTEALLKLHQQRSRPTY